MQMNHILDAGSECGVKILIQGYLERFSGMVAVCCSGITKIELNNSLIVISLQTPY